MKFSFEKTYLILENLINLSETRILQEIDKKKDIDLQSLIDKEQYLGKGVELGLYDYLGELETDGDETLYDVILTEDGVRHVFQMEEFLGTFPLIEGKFIPGIYQVFEDCQYYEIKSLENLSGLISENQWRFFEMRGLKLICTSNGIDVFRIEDNREEFLEKLSGHPFNFYDLYCPICSEKIITYEMWPDDREHKCQIKKLICPHYLGMVCSKYGMYEPDEFDDQQFNCKLVNNELYIQTKTGWERPLIYAPAHDPLNSYWNNSEDYGYVHELLFLETGKILPKRKKK